MGERKGHNMFEEMGTLMFAAEHKGRRIMAGTHTYRRHSKQNGED